jgi:hypothetical protein
MTASVIFLWLPGGPPHMETYDMKPDAPVEYRGDFKPIHTNVPGLDVCEHMPLHAQTAHRYSLIRSIITTPSAITAGGHKKVSDGSRPVAADRLCERLPHGRLDGRQGSGKDVQRFRTMWRGPIPAEVGLTCSASGRRTLAPLRIRSGVPGDPSSPKFTVRNLDAPPDPGGAVE